MSFVSMRSAVLPKGRDQHVAMAELCPLVLLTVAEGLEVRLQELKAG